MCTIHLIYKVFEDAPVLIMANRDELIDRAWTPPALLSETPKILGPRDMVAGGTWMGVNEAGVTVGLTNHFGTLATGASLCSRGYVVMETLRHTTALEARRFAEIMAPVCKSYTLMIADPDHAFVVQNIEGDLRTYELMPGPHVLTNRPFRTPYDPKAQLAHRRMAQLIDGSEGELPTPVDMRHFLADHEPTETEGFPFPLCVHPPEGERFATTSASAITVNRRRKVTNYLFAPGQPCQTPWDDVTPGDW
jgi:uncharacterized protein with NRDE domain